MGFEDHRSNTRSKAVFPGNQQYKKWKWAVESAGEDGAGSLLAVGQWRDSMADEAGEMGEVVT